MDINENIEVFEDGVKELDESDYKALAEAKKRLRGKSKNIPNAKAIVESLARSTR